jgi:tetratricopeptide (TPR) repeat protein
MKIIKEEVFDWLIMFFIILFLSTWTHQRNVLWNNEIDLWIDCVKKSPHKARPYVNLGFAYYNAEIYEKALETTQKAIQIDSKSNGAYYNLSLIFQEMGDLNKAIAMGKKSLEIDPEMSMAYYALGGIYFKNGQYEEAEEAYKKFMKNSPYFPEAHNHLGVVYAVQKQFDKAVKEFEWEIRINPYNALTHLNLGQIYWHEFQDRQKAIHHLKTALMINPFLPNRTEIRRLVRLLEGSS